MEIYLLFLELSPRDDVGRHEDNLFDLWPYKCSNNRGEDVVGKAWMVRMHEQHVFR